MASATQCHDTSSAKEASSVKHAQKDTPLISQDFPCTRLALLSLCIQTDRAAGARGSDLASLPRASLPRAGMSWKRISRADAPVLAQTEAVPPSPL